MPYITQKARKELKLGRNPETVGEVNYLISCKFNELWKTKPCYDTINEIESIELGFNYFDKTICIGWKHHKTILSFSFSFFKEYKSCDFEAALRCAKQEFHRRIAAPYEDKCIKNNGDIYD